MSHQNVSSLVTAEDPLIVPKRIKRRDVDLCTRSVIGGVYYEMLVNMVVAPVVDGQPCLPLCQ
ncbi:hypothetical protein MPL3356_340069 [Mesorhizobium plurifarium]|uniref:Uncharacterized protein n=1 Tax=Mesorhizobium plurifarium TaxID=69974 RepID=A0A090E1F0_MESPL|nr:hypothetical protein MPL3356_340069 [Mesorhizobium plurifarium]